MANLTFNAVDVETANRDRASICQIGVVQVRHGQISNTFSLMINPEERFEQINTSIHGIDEDSVRGADTMPCIYPLIWNWLARTAVVSHTAFDRQAFEKAAMKYGLPSLPVLWLDSEKIARSTWPERYASGGRSLKKIASDLGITFQHHDAEEDARVAAEILLHAFRSTGLDVSDWLKQTGWEQKTKPPVSRAIILTDILMKEQYSGYMDKSVLGGMDGLLHHQAEAIKDELGDFGPHRILLTIPYSDLTFEERAWWVECWIRIIVQRR